jgi:hypothetical protein
MCSAFSIGNAQLAIGGRYMCSDGTGADADIDSYPLRRFFGDETLQALALTRRTGLLHIRGRGFAAVP